MKSCPNTAMPHRSATMFVVEMKFRGGRRSRFRCLECGYEWEGAYDSGATAAADDERVRRLIE